MLQWFHPLCILLPTTFFCNPYIFFTHPPPLSMLNGLHYCNELVIYGGGVQDLYHLPIECLASLSSPSPCGNACIHSESQVHTQRKNKVVCRHTSLQNQYLCRKIKRDVKMFSSVFKNGGVKQLLQPAALIKTEHLLLLSHTMQANISRYTYYHMFTWWNWDC